jgi:hypothetical protein
MRCSRPVVYSGSCVEKSDFNASPREKEGKNETGRTGSNNYDLGILVIIPSL